MPELALSSQLEGYIPARPPPGPRHSLCLQSSLVLAPALLTATPPPDISQFARPCSFMTYPEPATASDKAGGGGDPQVTDGSCTVCTCHVAYRMTDLGNRALMQKIYSQICHA